MNFLKEGCNLKIIGVGQLYLTYISIPFYGIPNNYWQAFLFKSASRTFINPSFFLKTIIKWRFSPVPL